MPRETRVHAVIGQLALAAVAFALGLYTRADADLWGHLRFGLDVAREWRLDSIDPYSFTQDTAWINHEWLSELQMAWAYQAAGVPGLLALKSSLLLVAFALAWRSLAGAAPGARLLSMVILAAGTIHMTSSMRPQLWTFFCLAVLLRVLSSGVRRPWALPALFVFWVNCHGGWIVGLGVLGAWAAGDIARWPAGWKRWLTVVTVCVLATLVNPYGAGLWRFIAATVRLSRDISEWEPLWTTPWVNWLPWMAAVAALPWMWRRAPASRLPIALVLGMLAFASARVLRLESLFVLAAVMLLGPIVAARWPTRAPRGVARVVPSLVGSAALVVAALTVWLTVVPRATACVSIVGTWAPDLEAAAALRGAGRGFLVVPFDWGQYAIWHFGPRLRVSIDGRRETIYSDRFLQLHAAILRGEPRGLAALDAWRVEYAWLPIEARTTTAWLLSHGYRLDVETARSVVAVRDDLPRLTLPGQAGACFPG